MKTFFLANLLLATLISSCEKNSQDTEFTGVVQKQGMTTYQYGTHVITSGNSTYALKSAAVNLDKYTSKTVTVVGEKIKGYPVDGGPEYLEVKSVK